MPRLRDSPCNRILVGYPKDNTGFSLEWFTHLPVSSIEKPLTWQAGRKGLADSTKRASDSLAIQTLESR